MSTHNKTPKQLATIAATAAANSAAATYNEWKVSK